MFVHSCSTSADHLWWGGCLGYSRESCMAFELICDGGLETLGLLNWVISGPVLGPIEIRSVESWSYGQRLLVWMALAPDPGQPRWGAICVWSSSTSSCACFGAYLDIIDGLLQTAPTLAAQIRKGHSHMNTDWWIFWPVFQNEQLLRPSSVEHEAPSTALDDTSVSPKTLGGVPAGWNLQP